MKIFESAYAKLNLTLDVTGKREDGYHDMLMVMQTVAVMDSITIEEDGGPGIRRRCRDHEGSCGLSALWLR